MGNREADKWEPLFAIADVIGGAWPNKMRAAVGSLKPVVDDSEAISVQLLHDVWGNFGEDSERMFTDEILEALHRMEERPWRQWYKGSAISSSQLSKRLGAFGITSRQIRHSGDNRRGYRKQDLADAVLHYPLAQGVTTLQVNGDGASSGFEGVTPNPFVTPPNALKPLPDNGCNTVTPAQGGKPEDEDNPPPPTVRETF